MRLRQFRLASPILAASMILVACGSPAASEAADPVTSEAPDPVASEAPDGDAVAQFYSENDIRIVVPVSPGGSYDIAGRTVAAHLAKYVPGGPRVTLEYQPGADHVLGANAVYTREPQDGTVLVTFSLDRVIDQAVGRLEGIQFDAAEFQWLGSLRSSVTACFARSEGPVSSIEEVEGGAEWIIGTSGGLEISPLLVDRVLGTDITQITGYDGMAELVLAVEQGEVDGLCTSVDNAALLGLLERGVVEPLIVLHDATPQIHAAYEGVPLLFDYPMSDEDLALYELFVGQRGNFASFAVGPGVPSERVEALRSAFNEMVMDPDFQDDYASEDQVLQYGTGEEVEETIDSILNADPAILELGEQLLGGEG